MNRRFWLYLSGRTVSSLGDGMGTIAMVWMVYALTGSKLAMGSLYVTGLAAELVVRLAGAPLLDRVNRLRLMALLDGLLFIAYMAPLALSLTGHLTIWHLYVLQGLAGMAIGLYAPAAVATLPNLVERSQLVRATSLLSGFMQGARVSGPLLAGLLIRFTTSETTMAIDGLTFALSAVSMLLLPAALGLPRSAGPRPGYIGQLQAGFAFFRRVPALLLLTLLNGISYMSSYAIFTMHVPYAQEHLQAGAETAGFLQGFWPLGFVLGSLAVGLLANGNRRRTVMLGGLTTIGIALSSLGFVSPGFVPLALLFKAMEGFGFALFSNTFTAAFQTIVPDAMRGRASAVQMLLSWGGNPLGAFLGATLSEQIGIGPTFMLMGSLSVIAGLVGFAVPMLRTVDGDLTQLDSETIA